MFENNIRKSTVLKIGENKVIWTAEDDKKVKCVAKNIYREKWVLYIFDSLMVFVYETKDEAARVKIFEALLGQMGMVVCDYVKNLKEMITETNLNNVNANLNENNNHNSNINNSGENAVGNGNADNANSNAGNANSNAINNNSNAVNTDNDVMEMMLILMKTISTIMQTILMIT